MRVLSTFLKPLGLMQLQMRTIQKTSGGSYGQYRQREIYGVNQERYRVPNCFIRLSMYFDHIACEGLCPACSGLAVVPAVTAGAVAAVAPGDGILPFEALEFLSAGIIVNLMFVMPCDSVTTELPVYHP